ncbi:unnamed protein product [Ostreobium quekettii]|uniref:Tetratricopeptide repeat protein n=1 Tax=Ostreobium quekettii TaxID=121088 RepID=A0A8S1J4X0_9CHLO|nr:unnamed protein product [Ostreobium quekettii]|eukprot:evm.model.scf_131.15 EVM.evm.TU.scf_131.15   scf_131:107714-109393(+)
MAKMARCVSSEELAAPRGLSVGTMPRCPSSDELSSRSLRSPSCVSSLQRESGPLELSRRSAALGMASAVLGSALFGSDQALALPQDKAADGRVKEAVSAAFTDSGIPEVADSGWTHAIEADPMSADQWANRGTCRLQFGQWEDAKRDFDVALALADDGPLDGTILNKRATAKGAMGDWDGAIEDLTRATNDPTIKSVAHSNLALAFFQVGREATALKEARYVKNLDPLNLEVRCALAAFLWCHGSEKAAVEQWEELQGNGNQLGAVLYNGDCAVERVQGRWPPRATAALVAFLERKKTGIAMDFNGQEQLYSFA